MLKISSLSACFSKCGSPVVLRKGNSNKYIFNEVICKNNHVYGQDLLSLCTRVKPSFGIKIFAEGKMWTQVFCLLPLL